MARLGDICEIQSGGTPARSNSSYWDGGTIPWVKISDIRGKCLQNTEEFITENGLQNSSAKIFPKGTILYSIFATLGETCILDIDAATNQAIAGLTIKKDNVYREYLYYYLVSLKPEINSLGRGVAQNNINLSILRNLSVPLPPLEEQGRIAAVLDKVSDLIAKRRQQLDKLDELVKSRFIELFGDPVSNPKGWKKVALGKRCEIVTGNTPSRAEPENYGEFIEWIKSDNIHTPFTLITKAQEYLSEVGFQKCRFVEAGSVLMTCIAGSISCIGNVAVTDRRVAFNQQINAIIPKQDEVLYLYWLMLLSKPAIHSTINMALKGILSKGQLSDMVFPFPPKDLQEQFAAFVEQTDKSKLAIQKSFEKLEILKKALMQEYFR